MPLKLVSAGVYVREFDFSDYAAQLAGTTLAIIGGASKGKLNTPTLVLTEPDLIQQFGKPLLTDFALQAALRALKRGARVLFNRIANGDATASVDVPGQLGGTAAVKASGTIVFSGSVNPADADFVKIRKYVPYATLENDGNGALGNVTVTKTGSVLQVTGMTGGTVSTRAQGSVIFLGSANPADGDLLTIGDGAASKVFEFDSNSSTGGGNIAVTINADPYVTLANLVAAINGASSFNVSAADQKIEKIFEFDSNSSYTNGRVPVLIGATAAATMNNLISAIALQPTLAVTATNTTVTVPQATITANTGGVLYNSLLAKSGANITVSGETGGTDAVAGSVSTVMTLTANSPGSWGNYVTVTVTQPSVIIGAGGSSFDLTVNAPVDDAGNVGTVERFTNLSLDSASDRFVEKVLSHGIVGEVGSSHYIAASVVASSVNPTAGAYLVGSGTAGADGVSGLVESDYVGTVSNQISTGLKALANPEAVEFNILAAPGVSKTNVINAMIQLCVDRQDCICLIDPPLGLSVDSVIDWHNGVNNSVPNAPVAAINDNHAAIYWPWVYDYDSYNKKNVWLPPSGFVAGACAYNDSQSSPWAAVAGRTRGVISGLKVELSAYQADRDKLCGLENRINPIVNFHDTGLTIFGNRTTQRKATALDSVHTRRGLLFAEKLCATAVKVLNFEPNDPLTWKKFETLVNPILQGAAVYRGIASFKVICDATTNPPQQIRQKTMRAKLLIEALDVAEIIVLDFALFANGAQFDVNF